MTKVSIIVLTWNGKKDTLECLKSLAKLTIKNFQLEIVVVDNASTDETAAAVKEFSRKFASATNKTSRKEKERVAQIRVNSRTPAIKYIKNRTNLGFAEGNNVGMRYAIKKDADYVMLLNNDTYVDKNLVTDLIKEFKKYPTAGVLSPKIYFAKGFEFHKDRYKKNELGQVIWYAGGDIDWDNVYGSNHGVDKVDKGQFEKVSDTDFATGCCMFFRSEVLKKVGLFDKRYFAYLEDADLSQRIKNAGWRVLYTPNAYLWHKVGQALGIGSERNDYYITRNRLLFGIKHSSLRTKFALIRESIKLLLKGRKWQSIGVRDYYLGRFEEGSWK